MMFLKTLFKGCVGFFKDSAISFKDKSILLALLVYIISPIDLIPDAILGLGQIDDFFVLCFFIDYFNKVANPQLVAKHFPFQSKNIERFFKFLKFFSFFVPKFLRKKLWR